MTKKWPKYKDEILKLYLEENKPLHEVRRIMAEKHNFSASFDKWGVMKYKVQKRRNSTTTEASSISSPLSDDLHAQLVFSPGAHPPMMARLYSSPELSSFAPDDVVRMDNSRYPLGLNSRSQDIYVPLDTDMQSPNQSISPASPPNAFPLLPYNSMSGPGYENNHVRGSNLHPALRMTATGDDEHLVPWKTETSNVSYHYGNQLYNLLRTPSWWLKPSTLNMIIEELNYPDVNSQNALGETPLYLFFSSFQTPIHPAQVDVLLHLLHTTGLDMRCHLPDSYNPLGVTMERTLESRRALTENEDMAVSLCKCLCKLLSLGANPDIIVHGRSIAHHFFQDADGLMAYTTFWPFLESLCWNTTPAIPDSFGNTLLHCAITSRDGGRNKDASALARMQSAITTLVERSAAHGALDDRNADGRTALQLLVEYWRADGEFWRMSRDLVGAGADTQDIVSKRFAADLRELAGSRGARAHDLQRYVRGDVPLSVIVWLSACGQRTDDSWREHLWALESCPGLDVQLLESLLRSPWS